MELKHLSAAITAELELTDSELGILAVCSEEHYDSKCVAASTEDGFITTWALLKQRLNMTSRATWQELDTCCKILEQAHFTFSDNGRMQFESKELERKLKALMLKISDITKELNETLKRYYD